MRLPEHKVSGVVETPTHQAFSQDAGPPSSLVSVVHFTHRETTVISSHHIRRPSAKLARHNQQTINTTPTYQNSSQLISSLSPVPFPSPTVRITPASIKSETPPHQRRTVIPAKPILQHSSLVRRLLEKEVEAQSATGYALWLQHYVCFTHAQSLQIVAWTAIFDLTVFVSFAPRYCRLSGLRWSRTEQNRNAKWCGAAGPWSLPLP